MSQSSRETKGGMQNHYTCCVRKFTTTDQPGKDIHKNHSQKSPKISDKRQSTLYVKIHNKQKDHENESTGDLRSEPLHDMNGCLDQLQSQLHYYCHTQTTRTYACQQQSAQIPTQESIKSILKATEFSKDRQK
ncbi:hypothetical protein HS088_TW17G00055 [Tripterygium wilfordii]|uniref:Uncharacterized protein n=1 Tax=Tripterygium wilfordii TaxID=458696 RepID=A0A7J7CEG0_TRIWF|nr:hypothetical protein HS088_TW17G00055 [Tripterygium wilfordii]